MSRRHVIQEVSAKGLDPRKPYSTTHKGRLKIDDNIDHVAEVIHDQPIISQDPVVDQPSAVAVAVESKLPVELSVEIPQTDEVISTEKKKRIPPFKAKKQKDDVTAGDLPTE